MADATTSTEWMFVSFGVSLEFKQDPADANKQLARAKLITTRKRKDPSSIYASSGAGYYITLGKQLKDVDIDKYSGANKIQCYGSSIYVVGEFNTMLMTLIDEKLTQLNRGVDMILCTQTWEGFSDKWQNPAYDADNPGTYQTYSTSDTVSPWILEGVSGAKDMRQHPSDANTTQERMKCSISRSRIMKDVDRHVSNIGTWNTDVTGLDKYVGVRSAIMQFKYQTSTNLQPVPFKLQLTEEVFEQVGNGVNVIKLTENWQGYSDWINFNNPVLSPEE